MKSCPTCGAQLTDQMVDAIGNPQREESCPKAKRKSKSARNEKKEPTLETLLLLGSLSDLE